MNSSKSNLQIDSIHIAVRLFSNRSKNGIYLCYIIKEKKTTREKKLFNFETFNILRKPALAHFVKHEIYCFYKTKQSHWLLCEAINCDWSRNIAPLSLLNPASSES